MLAHGAGAGMKHPFMARSPQDSPSAASRRLRYQFLYMERGGKRPDPPKLAHAAVRAAVAEAARRLPELPLIAGGKSFGGRMTSQAQAAAPLPGVRGLAFLGFPLHPAKQPSSRARQASVRRARADAVPAGHPRRAGGARSDRAAVQGARRARATLQLFEDADHSFHVPARSGRTDAQVMDEMLDAFTTLGGRADRPLISGYG